MFLLVDFISTQTGHTSYASREIKLLHKLSPGVYICSICLDDKKSENFFSIYRQDTITQSPYRTSMENFQILSLTKFIAYITLQASNVQCYGYCFLTDFNLSRKLFFPFLPSLKRLLGIVIQLPLTAIYIDMLKLYRAYMNFLNVLYIFLSTFRKRITLS